MRRMKRLLFALLPLFALSLSARSQVIIINDNMMVGRLSEIHATVVDSLTLEPVSFASVYLIPSKDTTITNFTLSDMDGKAKLDDIPYGSYTFHVEMLGYKPFVRERYFRDRRVDMGTIKLTIDEEFLEAAVVTDVGNPIIIKKDTVEFNASSYRVGSNAMLKDLLKRMPGMEITEDGKVKFNGEAIDKLTVGGRTFFFGDQETALNNLPAAVVDKIRVIDRDTEATRATGIADGKKEKVLDVGLKKEYEKGWFGNAGVKGGSTLSFNEDDELRDSRGFLYGANVLASAYNEKDQLTLIGNTQNVDDSGMVMVIMNDNGSLSDSSGGGLSSTAQAGVNLNTTRIKDVETTVGANYKYVDTEAASRSSRTTFQEDGDLLSDNSQRSRQYVNTVSTSLEMRKEKGDVWFSLYPSVDWTRTHGFKGGDSETSREGVTMNSSANNSENLSDRISADIGSSLTFRRIGGKEGRSLRFYLDGGVASTEGESSELSVLSTAAGESRRNLTYDSTDGQYSVEGAIDYTEPLSSKLMLNADASFSYGNSSAVRDAFDSPGKRNDYYSSESKSLTMQQQYGLTVQYKFSNTHTLTLGASASGMLNETFSKSFGISQTTGEDEWSWFVSPRLQYRWTPDAGRLSFSLSGSSRKPSNNLMLAVLNVADPSRLSMGNIYLKPSGNSNFMLSWSGGKRELFRTYMLAMFGTLQTNPVSYARWYDTDGVLYSLPLNSRKPTLTLNFNGRYTTPLDSKKEWSLSLGGGAAVSSSTSYQPGKTLPALDKDKFDYSAFMDSFWGPDESGSIFYSGGSGFSESSTLSLSPNASVNVKYNRDRWYIDAFSMLTGRIARYSLDPSMNLNTLDTRVGLEGSYTTKHEFELKSDIAYAFYTGYSEGYGQPELQWNAEVSKSVGAFVLSLKVNDILDQTRSLSHLVTANYMEDTYRLVMGRFVLFGVKWNFGKMNAANSRRANRAAWDLAF